MTTNKFLHKVASTYEDALIGGLSNYATARLVGGPALAATALGGQIHGLVADVGEADPLESLQKLEGGAAAAIPGNRRSRYLRRQRLVTALLRDSRNKDFAPGHVWHQSFSMLNPLNIAAAPFAALGAAITPTRTLSEHSEVVNDPNRNVKQWLIPGYAVYNKYKELGLSNRLSNLKDTIAELESSGNAAELREYLKLINRSEARRKARARKLKSYA